MKQKLITCLLCLLIANTSFSQTISTLKEKDSLIVITTEQLKISNLIFLEHEKLLKTNSLYKKQIYDMESIINNYSKIDSIQKSQIDNCLIEINNKNKEIDKLNKKRENLSKWNRIKNWVIIGLTSSIGVIILGM